MPPSETPRGRASAARLIALLAALAAVTALAACGSSNPATDAAAREHAAERSEEQKGTEFAKCLREHGVNASATSVPGGGQALRIQGSPGTGKQSLEGPMKACAKYQPGAKRVNLSPQEKVKREEEVLKFAKCMREHGIEVHTEVGGGKIAIGIHGNATGPNPGSPAFQSAQKACSGYLQLKGKGGFAAPPPGGGKEEGSSSSHPGPSESVQSFGG
jgi:hypothetical protein